MAVYSISYDLYKEGQSYEALIKELKSFDSWCHLMKSYWLISTPKSADEIYEKLNKHLDKNDHALVLQASKDFRGWLSLKGCDWIQEHI